MNHNKIILTIILLLAFVLRVWQVNSLPPGLTWDEAALGYNAYSILKTGHGEHGRLLPIVFKSFGDYKPGVYIYADVPFVALFGLNEFSTRLVSVLAGTFTVLLVYLFTQILLNKKNSPQKIAIGLWPALALAINPWHIHFSRGAWEVNLFVFLLLLSLILLLKSLNKRIWIIPALIIALITLDTYQAAKMLTPLLWSATLIIYWPQTRQLISDIRHRKVIVGSIIVVALMTLALLIINVTGPTGNRLNRLSLFNYHPAFSGLDKKIDQQNQLSLNIFHGQFDLLYHAIASRYLYHFSPEVLFYEGPIISDRGHIPHMGMMYMTDAFWIVLGLMAIVKIKNKQTRNLLIAMLLLSPIPASLTLSEFSTTRALFMVIPLTILVGLGMEKIIRKAPLMLAVIFVSFYIFNITYGLDLYFFHSSAGIAQEYNYGYKQAVEDIIKYPAKNVIFTDVYGQPYIYYLFYTKYDPREFQQHNDFVDEGIDVGHVGRVANVEFHQFAPQEIFNRPDSLFIGTIGNIPDNFNYQDPKIDYYEQINAPDGRVVFRVVKSK